MTPVPLESRRGEKTKKKPEARGGWAEPDKTRGGSKMEKGFLSEEKRD